MYLSNWCLVKILVETKDLKKWTPAYYCLTSDIMHSILKSVIKGSITVVHPEYSHP